MSHIRFTSPWAYELSWRLRPGFLRSPGTRSKILFAGPWVGEFGWELMNWQAYVRALHPHYERVVVSCRASSASLYEDFCNDFVFHDIAGTPNCHVMHNVRNPDEVARVHRLVPAGADHVQPLRYVPAGEQAFVRFGSADDAMKTDILIHARGKVDVAQRNWGIDKWIALIAQLQNAGLTVAAIGLPTDTLDLEGVADHRGEGLGEVMNRMASARMVIGPSSGPLHLASLCGAPHLVWTDKRTYAMRKTSREKYETWWNPLSTPVQVIDDAGFDPSVDHVMTGVEGMLRMC